MKILLSAYACEPDKGSEPGVGWNWARTLVQLGHEVHLITRANNRPAVDAAIRLENLRLTVSYYDLPVWSRRWKRGGRGIHLYYLLWQVGIYRLAKKVLADEKFDVIHHISFGVFRDPSFLAFCGRPFIFGPVGGGEEAPRQLMASFPPALRAKELLRSIANELAQFNPVLRAMYANTCLTFCKTPETAKAVAKHTSKLQLQLEIGCAHPSHSAPAYVRRKTHGIRMLFVGRLLSWKGPHLAVRSFSQARARGIDIELTIVGSGPDEAWVRETAKGLGILDQISWIPWTSKERLATIYQEHDLFLFPSLHDSSGNVVLEALAHGLSVICLDLGGPACISRPDCGAIVETRGRSEREIVDCLTDQIEGLFNDPDRLTRSSDAARRRAVELTWTSVVGEAYRKVAQAIQS